MIKIKRFVSACLLLALVFTAICSVGSPTAFAVDITSDVCKTADNRPAVCSDATNATTGNPLLGPDGIVTKGIQIFLVIIGIITIFVMLINGLRMITSMGNPESMNKARDGVIYGAVGLVIILLAQVIVVTVIKKV